MKSKTSPLLYATFAFLVCCSLSLSQTSQPDNQSPQSVPKVRLLLRDFRFSEKSQDLIAIAGFLPGLLRASLFHYRWIEVASPQADVKQTKTPESGSDNSFLTDTGSSDERASRERSFLLDGSLVTVKDKVRFNLSVTAASNNALVFSNSAVFTSDTLVQEVDALVARMAEAVSAKVGTAHRSQSSIAVLSPFAAQSKTDSFQALATLIPDALVTLIPRAQREAGATSDTRFSEVAQTPPGDTYDAVLSGSYSAVSNGLVVRTELHERRGVVLSLSFHLAQENATEIPDFLARRICELLRGRMTPDGLWKPEPLIEAEHPSFPALATEAKHRLDNKDVPGAIVLYRKAIELQVQEVPPHLELADLYTAQKDFEAARVEYAAALALDPNSARALYGTGNVALAQGKNPDAATAFRKALSLAPKDRGISILSYKGLGDLALLQGQYDQAVSQYEAAKKIANSQPGQIPSTDDTEIELYRSIAKAYVAGKQVPKAIAYLADARQRFPDRPELTYDLAADYLESGDELSQTGKYTDAQTQFRTAVTLLPNDAPLRPSALIRLGEALSQTGNDKEALPLLQQAVAMDPKNERGFHALGDAYFDAEQYDQSVGAFQNAIAIQPSVYSYEVLAECYRLKGQYDLAEESVRDALRLNPASDTAYVRLGQIYHDSKKFDQALESLRKALALDPKQEYAYFGMAQTYKEMHDLPRAIENQNAAIKISPSAKNYYWLGYFYEDSSDYEAAIAALRKSIAADPDYRYSYTLFRQICQKQGDLAPYRQLLEDELRTHPSSKWLHAKLGSGYNDAGMYRQAIPHLSQALSLDSTPGEPKEHVHRQLGFAYHKTGQLELAISALKDGVLADGDDSTTYQELDSVYAERKEPEKFFEFLLHLSSDKSVPFTALVRLGDEYRLRNEYDKAINILTQAASLNQKSEWPWRVLGFTYRDKQDADKALEAFSTANSLSETKWSFFEISKLLMDKQKYDHALENADHALKMDDQYVDAYMTKAQILFQQKKLSEAIALLETATQKVPSSSDLKSDLAWYYNQAHDYGKAADSCRAALAISPKDAPAYNILANVELEQKHYEDALRDVRKAIEYDPTNEDNYPTLREIYHALGQDAELVNVLKQLLVTQSKNIGLLSTLGFVEHEYTADFPSAYEHYSEAFELDKKRLMSQENFAEASLTYGHFTEAQDLARNVLLDRTLSPEEKLSMNLLSIASQLFLSSRGTAFAEVGQFLDYYRSIPQGLDRSWSYDGTRKYVLSSGLGPAEKELLVKLIDALEASKEERDTKAKELANSLDQRLHELAQ